MEDTIKQFLEFRKQFTPLQWQELERTIDYQFKKKADELQLDDQDIKEITDKVLSDPFIW